MGAYLSEPKTNKEITEEEDKNFWVSSASMQGWRVNQEVRHANFKFISCQEILHDTDHKRIC